MTVENVYTTKQAAKILGLAVSTVHRFCKSGYLPATRIGWAYLLHGDDLRKFLAEGKVRSAGQPRKIKTEGGNQ